MPSAHLRKLMSSKEDSFPFFSEEFKVMKILFSKSSYRHLKSIQAEFCFVHSDNFAVSTSEKQFILKSIFPEEESEEGDEFHVSQNQLDKRTIAKSLTFEVF